MLTEHGIKIAVASSSSLNIINTVLSQHGLKNYFNCIVSGVEVLRGKPSPDIFIEASKRLQIGNSHCVVFEDAIDGIRAAKSAGMKCIAIPSFLI